MTEKGLIIYGMAGRLSLLGSDFGICARGYKEKKSPQWSDHRSPVRPIFARHEMPIEKRDGTEKMDQPLPRGPPVEGFAAARAFSFALRAAFREPSDTEPKRLARSARLGALARHVLEQRYLFHSLSLPRR